MSRPKLRSNGPIPPMSTVSKKETSNVTEHGIVFQLPPSQVQCQLRLCATIMLALISHKQTSRTTSGFCVFSRGCMLWTLVLELLLAQVGSNRPFCTTTDLGMRRSGQYSLFQLGLVVFLSKNWSRQASLLMSFSPLSGHLVIAPHRLYHLSAVCKLVSR